MSLFTKLINNTGLPTDLISKELSQQIQKKGLSVEDLTLEDLRTILSEYLQDVILNAKNNFKSK